MRKTFCDRCHEEIASAWENKNKLIKTTGLCLEKAITLNSVSTDAADLCMSCGKGLKEWYDSYVKSA